MCVFMCLLFVLLFRGMLRFPLLAEYESIIGRNTNATIRFALSVAAKGMCENGFGIILGCREGMRNAASGRGADEYPSVSSFSSSLPFFSTFVPPL